MSLAGLRGGWVRLSVLRRLGLGGNEVVFGPLVPNGSDSMMSTTPCASQGELVGVGSAGTLPCGKSSALPPAVVCEAAFATTTRDRSASCPMTQKLGSRFVLP